MVRILALENGQKFKASLVRVLMRLCPSGNKRRGGGGEKRGSKRKGEERKEGKEDILAIEAPVFSASFPSLSLPFSSLLLSPPFLPLSLPVYAGA